MPLIRSELVETSYVELNDKAAILALDAVVSTRALDRTPSEDAGWPIGLTDDEVTTRCLS
jgi:hypothetical protein